MNLPTALVTIRWMIRDTFRQSLASRLFWVMLGVTSICILFCLSVKITGDDPLPLSAGEEAMRVPEEEMIRIGREKAQAFGAVGGLGGLELAARRLGADYVRRQGVDVFNTELSLGFGVMKVHKGKDRVDVVRFLQIWLAGAVADTAGIFLVLIWTAGFLPTFLDPNQITVLLAKPVPRWSLLLGKFFGVLVFVALQASIFVLGTWLALGIRTNVWDGLYFFTIPLLIVHFGIFYSFSVLLAVLTRNTVVCVFGSLLFWVMCWGMNYGRHAIVAHDLPGLTSTSKTIVETCYWTLPKPGDLSLLLFDALQADNYAMKLIEFKKVQEKKQFHPEMSLIASLLFAGVILALAAKEFETMDY